MNRPTCWIATACALFVPAFVPSARAQDADKDIDKDTIKQLVQRLADSERRIQALEEKLAVLANAQTTPPPAAPVTPAPPPAVTAAAVVDALSDMDHSSHDGTGPLGRLQFQGYGDVTYNATAPQAPAAANQFAELATGHTNGFALGELDFF